MKKIALIIFSLVFVLSQVAPVCAAGLGTDEKDIIPTTKSTTPVDPWLLMNLSNQSKAPGDTMTVSLDSSGFPTIRMTAVVRDAAGDSIDNLTLADFMVTEQSESEGAPTIETIESFTATFAGGVSLGLLFDLSGSMLVDEWISAAKADALCLLDAMGADDRALLMSFSGPESATVLLPSASVTTDADADGQNDIAEGINALTTVKGYSTAIYDAVAAAVNAMAAEAQPKALLLFTDGFSNNDQLYDINDVIQMATDAGIPVFTLIYGDLEQQIEELATATGGLAISDPTCEAMDSLYDDLTADMSGAYTLVYTTHNPLEDGTIRTVELTQDGTTAAATYTAPGSPPVPAPCTKGCGGGSGCFVQTAGKTSAFVPAGRLLFLPVIVAALGLAIFLVRRFSRKQAVFLAISVLAVSGLVADAARAELRKGALSISPMVGLYYFDDDQEIEKDAAAGFGLGYQFADQWATELMLNYGEFDYHYRAATQCRCLTDDVTALLGRLDLLYYLWPAEKLVPYLAAGLGVIDLDFDDFDDEDNVFADYGGGVQYFLSDDIALRADVRGIRTLGDDDNNLVATVGVTFLLGGKKRCADDGKTAAGAAGAAAAGSGPGVAGATAAGLAPVAVAVASRPADFQLLFDFNKSDINPVYHDNLKGVADYLNTGNILRVEGHTDSVGPEVYNQALSLRRAESVGQYLSGNFNVSPSLYYFIGFGESRPAADNATAEGRRLNRRAELQYLVAAEKPALADFDILFATDDVGINPALRDHFKQVADYLASFQEIILGIAGHADNTGSAAYNQDLSLRRALSVGDYLSTEFNVPRERLQYIGFGEDRPAADNATSGGRQLNRRAELEFFKMAE